MESLLSSIWHLPLVNKSSLKHNWSFEINSIPFLAIGRQPNGLSVLEFLMNLQASAHPGVHCVSIGGGTLAKISDSGGRARCS